jgi:hypothetical protein
MEVLVILLSSLLALISPVGIVGDRLVQNAIRKQLAGAEQLLVRIDATPTYQLLQGKADRIRIAGRGLYPLKDVRIEALELETDPIHLDAAHLRRGKTRLLEPLGTGIRLVVKAEDIQRALRSPATLQQIGKMGRFLSDRDSSRLQKIEVLNPQFEFVNNQRFRLQLELREKGKQDALHIFAETGLEVIDNTRLRLVNPVVRLDNQPAPEELVRGLSNGVLERSDLKQLEKPGVTARILALKLDRQQLELVAFVQIKPQNSLTRGMR